MNPKVSVIIPVYNSERFIKETIESVLNQTCQDFEIIIIDDGSIDKSAEIIKSFTDRRILYIYQKNEGVSAARNKGISASKGEYIAFLDHDDLWLPKKLEEQISVLRADSEIGLVYSDCYYVNIEKEMMKRFFEQSKPYRGAVFPEFFMSNFIPCLTAVVRKDVFKKVGLFNPGFSISEDYDLFLRIAELFKVEYIDMPLAKYRIHETNFSKNIILTHREEIEILSKYLKEKPEIKKIMGKKAEKRLADLYFSLGRVYQFQRNFAQSRREFLSSVKYRPFCIKPYIGYLFSLMGVVIPSREKS
jgi:glycosyltransferase involved in cell wall biosynthesis